LRPHFLARQLSDLRFKNSLFCVAQVRGARDLRLGESQPRVQFFFQLRITRSRKCIAGDRSAPQPDSALASEVPSRSAIASSNPRFSAPRDRGILPHPPQIRTLGQQVRQSAQFRSQRSASRFALKTTSAKARA
jgi:hypothetical protein